MLADVLIDKGTAMAHSYGGDNCSRGDDSVNRGCNPHSGGTYPVCNGLHMLTDESAAVAHSYGGDGGGRGDDSVNCGSDP